MRAVIWQLVIFALLGVLFFTRPDIVMGFFMGVLWLVFLLLLGMAGVYAFLKLSGRKAESLGIRLIYDGNLPEGIWVGSKGANLPLSIKEESRGLRIGWPDRNYILIIIFMTMFGPGLLALYCFQPERFHLVMPLPMQVMGGAVWLVAWWALITTVRRYFFQKPTLLISAQSIILQEGTKIKKTLWNRDITGIGVSEVICTSTDAPPVTNYILVATSADGTREGLCITDKQNQIGQLLQALRKKGYTADSSV